MAALVGRSNSGLQLMPAAGVSTSMRHDANLLPIMMLSIPRFSGGPRSARGRRRSTLLEIMIALAILALLVGLAVTNLDTIFGNAQGTTAKLFVSESIKLPLTSYRMATGDFPSTAEGLQALITAPASKADSWHGPYFNEPKIPLDPWGEPYVYRYPGVKNPSNT